MNEMKNKIPESVKSGILFFNGTRSLKFPWSNFNVTNMNAESSFCKDKYQRTK